MSLFVVVDGRTVRLIPTIEVAPKVGDTLIHYDTESCAVLTRDGAPRGFATPRAFGVDALSVAVLAAWVQGAIDCAEECRERVVVPLTEHSALAERMGGRAVDRYGCEPVQVDAYLAGASVAFYGRIQAPFLPHHPTRTRS